MTLKRVQVMRMRNNIKPKPVNNDNMHFALVCCKNYSQIHVPRKLYFCSMNISIVRNHTIIHLFLVYNVIYMHINSMIVQLCMYRNEQRA